MQKEFWFIVGSQDLYGEEVLETVRNRAGEMAEELSGKLHYMLVYKETGRSRDQITSIIKLHGAIHSPLARCG